MENFVDVKVFYDLKVMTKFVFAVTTTITFTEEC